MPESLFDSSRWVPASLKRKKNVAKYEAATGRLIWWREFQLGKANLLGVDGPVGLPVDIGPQEIVSIGGSEDVAVVMRGRYRNSAGVLTPTDYLFRISACGGQCLPWTLSLAEQFYFLTVHHSNLQRDCMFGAANGNIYVAGGVPGGGATRVYTADGVNSDTFLINGFPIGPPIVGIPTTNDAYLFRPTEWVDDPPPGNPFAYGRKINRVGPGSNWGRQMSPIERPLAANANGDLLTGIFGSKIHPLMVGTFPGIIGTVVRNGAGSGAQINNYGYWWDWHLYEPPGPPRLELQDNSVIAQHTTTTYAAPDFTPADLSARCPGCACAYADRWYVAGGAVLDNTYSSKLRCYSSSLGILWELAGAGFGGNRAFGIGQMSPPRQMFADERGVYVVTAGNVNGTACSVVKVDHDGDVIYGLNSAVAISACLSHDGKYLYTTG